VGASRREYLMTSAPAELEPMRAWLRAELAACPLSSGDRLSLLTAVGELCANSIAHAYRDEPGQPIHVALEVLDDRLVIEVEDFGRAFRPEAYRPPDLDRPRTGGVGLHIARSAADELTFDVARPRGTRWRLVKRLPGGAP
jgi:anti-sigma regulatory factor (Ser/Thr protein kinase)